MRNVLASVILHLAVLGGLAWLVQTEHSALTGAESFPVALQKASARAGARSSTLLHGASALASPMEPQERAPGTGLLARAEQPEQGDKDEYLAALRSSVDSRVDYPLSLQRRHAQGKTELKLSILPDGTLQSAEVASSSGSEELDRLALDSARKAAPFAPLPERLKKMGKLEVSLPVEFRLR